MSFLKQWWLMLAFALTALLGGCGGGDGGTAAVATSTTVSGSAIKGPLDCSVQGSVVATGAGGKTATGSTPSVGSFTVALAGLTFPVTVTASGCMDTIIGATQDFDLSTMVMDATQTTINATPISTLAIATAKAAKTAGGAITQADLDAAVATVLNTFSLSVSFPTPMTGIFNNVANITNLVVASEAVSEVIKRSATQSVASTANIVASFAADLADGALDGAAPAGVTIPVPVATASGINGNIIAKVLDEVASGNIMIHQVDPLTGAILNTLPSSALLSAVAAQATAITGSVVTVASIDPAATRVSINARPPALPVIALTGANPLTIAQGSVFTDPGSSVTDNVDVGLTATVTGTVNTAAVGSYTLIYHVSDAAGNAAIPVTRTVHVTDQTIPVIALLGASPLTIAHGSVFTDPGSSVTDNVDVGLTATVTGTVNTAIIGTYTLTYNVSDAAGNAAIAVTRTVNVSDQTAPVITLVGPNPHSIAQGVVFTDFGSIVTDNVDVGLTATVTGTVDTATVGTYTLTYNASDAAGNAARVVTRTVHVIDQTLPVITLTGAKTITVAQGSTYIDAGSTVTDNVDVGLMATVTGTVNTAVVGTYSLTYHVSDAAGNPAIPVTRTVNVTDQTAPVIALTGANSITIQAGIPYMDPGSIVTDNVDTGLTATVTGFVDQVVGSYILTYNATDAAGNTATPVTRTVNVIIYPTISIASVSKVEGSTLGTTNLVFTVTLSQSSTGVVSVNYTTADGTALSASDYTPSSATLSIPAGSTSGMITVLVNADNVFEANETLSLTLSNPVHGTLGAATATGTIINDDVGGLNDTGVLHWSKGATGGFTAPLPGLPGQDADHGRDAQAAAGTLMKVGGGRAGFDLTKLDAFGLPLANQAAVYATTPWRCVKDNVTGLMWEIKGNNYLVPGYKNDTFTWFNSSGVNDGGNAGTPNGGVCVGGVNCDTEKYVASVNAAGLCGFTDWRMPTIGELESIVDYSTPFPAYFPGFLGTFYSSSPSAIATTFSPSQAYAITNLGQIHASSKAFAAHVRLVRDGL